MINISTKQEIGTQYQIETELPMTFSIIGFIPAMELAAKLEELPHVQEVRFVESEFNDNMYVDCVVTIDTHADNSLLWNDFEKTFEEVTSNAKF